MKQTQTKKLWRTVLQTSLLVIVAISLGFGIYQFNAMTIGRNALPMPFGFGIAVVVSGSMEPTLSVDDLIVVTPADSYEVGDVVVFSTGSSLVVHRVIKIDGDTLTTQGDANNTADDPILIRDVKGKVTFSVPAVGVVVDFAKSTAGTLIILLGAGYLYYRSIQNERQEAKREIEKIREEIENLKK